MSAPETDAWDTIVDATPAAGRTVEVNGRQAPIFPLDIISVLNLVKRYPALKAQLFATNPDDIKPLEFLDTLITEFPQAVGAIMAMGAGKKGNADFEKKMLALPDSEKLVILNAILDVTMPHGPEAFFAQFLALGEKLGFKRRPKDKDKKASSKT